MANFVAVLDADLTRRAAYVDALQRVIAPIAGLSLGALELGPFSVVWAAGARAPISRVRTDDVLAVVWGDAYNGLARQDAARAAQAWRPALAGASPTVLDGYHAGVVFDVGRGLVAAPDLLGLYPMYYGTQDGVTIVASSASLFARHPSFGSAIDREGLAGILLSGATVYGRTARAAVRRLAAGHLVVVPHEHPATERHYYRVGSATDSKRSVAQHAADLRDTLREAHRQQIPASEPIGLLLSGGRDSRVHAAMLHEQRIRAAALTFGLPTDYDAQCAIAVARACGFTHRLSPLEPMRMPAAAALHTQWTDLAAGFNTVHTWSTLDSVAMLPPRFVTGYHFDTFFGRPANRKVSPFEKVFRVINSAEVSAEQVTALFGRDGPALVEAAKAQMQRELQELDDDPINWMWRMTFAVRERQQLGAVPWRLSFASWPVLPHLNRGVLDVIGAFSSACLAARDLQDALLIASYPRLASLPLDRNSENTTPLLPPRFPRLARWMQGSAARDAARPGPFGLERRYFVRTYNFNGEGWRAVRAMADAERDRVADVFDRQALDALLPAANVDVPCVDATLYSRSHKMLVGAVLWAARLRSEMDLTMENV